VVPLGEVGVDAVGCWPGLDTVGVVLVLTGGNPCVAKTDGDEAPAPAVATAPRGVFFVTLQGRVVRFLCPARPRTTTTTHGFRRRLFVRLE
jgi:hypothetical protein